MKKRLSLVLLLALLVTVLTVPALAEEPGLDYVTDASGILSSQEVDALNATASAISGRYHCGVYVVIIDDYQEYGDDMEDASDSIYGYYDLGLGSDQNGIILLMSMSERDYWLRSHGEIGAEALTNGGIPILADAFLPYFGNNQWYDGFAAYLSECEYFLNRAAAGDPIAPNSGVYLKALGWALIPGVLIGFLVCTILKSRMKTAVKKETAHEYVVPNGVQITQRTDHYTHTTTTRTKIERSSSSSSGGGSSSSGASGGGKF